MRYSTHYYDTKKIVNFKDLVNILNQDFSVFMKHQLIRIQILYDNGQSVEVDGKLTQKLITGLQPETQYSFLLTNRGNSAGGLQHRVSTMTAPDILRTKPYLIGKTNSDGMVTVELPSVQTSERVR